MMGLFKRGLCIGRKYALLSVALIVLEFVIYCCFPRFDYFNVIKIFFFASIWVFGSTFAADMRNNGLAFVRTLPFTPTQYVVSNYLLMLLGAVLAGVLATVCTCLPVRLGILNKEIDFWEYIRYLTIAWCMVLLIYSVITNLFSKFRFEIALYVLCAVVVILISWITISRKLFLARMARIHYSDWSSLSDQVERNTLSTPMFCLILFAVTIVLYFTFMLINIHVLEKKEY